MWWPQSDSNFLLGWKGWWTDNSSSSRPESREKLWGEFFCDPSQWWDCRPETVNVRYPDFTHMKMPGALWLGDPQNPSWVGEKLAARLACWMTRLFHFCGSAECVCQPRCTGRGQVCSWADWSGCKLVTFVGNSLVDMYAKCGSVEDAWRVFNTMSSRNVVCWNAMLLAHVNCGPGHKALELFQWIQEEGLQPDRVTLGGVLNACVSVVAK